MLDNRSMPRSTVIPELVYPDVAAAADWLADAFGFVLRWRSGGHRAQLAVGEGCIVAMEASEPFAAPGNAARTQAVMVRVEDVDAHHAQAAARGARILRAPADFPYGERQYTAADLAGHSWTFSQSIADVDPAGWGATLGPAA